MKLKVMFLALLVLFAVCADSSWNDYWSLRDAPSIDFKQVEPPASQPAQVPGEQPIRLAVASVFVPHDAVRFYRSIADY